MHPSGTPAPAFGLASGLGASIDDVLAWDEGLERRPVQAVIEFAARSLDLATTEH